MDKQNCVSCQKLNERIRTLEKELDVLKKEQSKSKFIKCDMLNSDIERYSRQIILPEIAVAGQLKLKKSSVLVVGMGGLGCPSSIYLAAAGVGHIGLLDYDSIDISNLQRQILHKESMVNISKVQSAFNELKRLNSSVEITTHNIALNSTNALECLKRYDLILDCTDNVATRYLLNDACVLLGKTLISGSALRFEGQLTVYHYGDGPCYRCLFPKPPPPETVTNCSDGGVVGAVTGVIGSLQALEAIKIIANDNCSYSGSLLLFDGYNGTFRKIKLRKKLSDCAICGSNPTVTSLIDYPQFCGTQPTDKELSLSLLTKTQRIGVQDYNSLFEEDNLLVDVRPTIEFEICHLNSAINIPLNDFVKRKESIHTVVDSLKKNKSVYMICKRGNDSQKAVTEILKYVEEMNVENINIKLLKDIVGGLTSWNKCIDAEFPIY